MYYNGYVLSFNNGKCCDNVKRINYSELKLKINTYTHDTVKFAPNLDIYTTLRPKKLF